MLLERFAFVFAFASPSFVKASCAGDKNASCPTLSCGFCGKNIGGCLSSTCSSDDFDTDLTDCSGGQCHYHCHCKNPSPPAPPSPSPPGPSPPAPPGPLPPPPPSPPPSPGTPWWIAHGGPYKQIAVETVNLPNPRGSASIVYPKEALSGRSDETFPFISFCHGGGVGGALTYTSYAADMQTIASFGFIVVATTVNIGGDPPLYSEQQRAVIKTCKANPSLHPALARADFSRVGVTGHSMGGIATRQTLASNEVAALNIKAGWLQHPCHTGDASKINVPAMWTTGSQEPAPLDIGCQQSYSENDFKIATNSRPRILFNVNGAGHLDPMYSCLGNTCRELIPGGLFLSCHVKGVSSDCDLLYGSTSRKVCSMGSDRPYPGKYTLKECDVAGRSYNTTVVV